MSGMCAISRLSAWMALSDSPIMSTVAHEGVPKVSTGTHWLPTPRGPYVSRNFLPTRHFSTVSWTLRCNFSQSSRPICMSEETPLPSPPHPLSPPHEPFSPLPLEEELGDDAVRFLGTSWQERHP